MKILRLVAREIAHRPGGFALAVALVAVATGSLVGSMTLLERHDRRTAAVLGGLESETEVEMARLRDDIRKTMLRLGLNVVILPEGQSAADWYANDYGTLYMPESYADRVATSNVVTVRHLLPVLQEKIVWPERERTVILVGTRGEVPNLHKDPRVPLVQPVPDGSLVAGARLASELGLAAGQTVTLFGRELTVDRCHEPRGTKDDVTLWIPLATAQEILGRRGLINAIIALQCVCAGGDMSMVREEMARVLPGAQIAELDSSKILARAEARARVGAESKATLDRTRTARADVRRERETASTVLVTITLVAAGIWIAWLAATNVRDRLGEIALYRALGFGSGRVLGLLLSRATLVGVAGGLLGIPLGAFVGAALAGRMEGIGATAFTTAWPGPTTAAVAFAAAVVLSVVASWAPAVAAARRDPADILSAEGL